MPLGRLFLRIPRRLETINVDLRGLAGFTAAEIVVLQELRERKVAPVSTLQAVVQCGVVLT